MAGLDEFDQLAKEHLLAAGWQEGRTCDARAMVTLLEEEGFHVNESALVFLAEFDGILLTFPNPKLPSMTVEYAFGSGMRVDLVSNRWVRDWERFSGEALTPIGTDQRGYGVLLVGASGAYYFGFDSNLSEIAKSMPLFFERLVSRESWRNIKVDTRHA